MSEEPISIGRDDLPALYKAADQASLEAQAQYISLFRWDLILLVGGASLSVVAPATSDQVRLVAGLGVAMLTTSLVLTILLAVRNLERTWYGGRAMAESTKSLAWKYMTVADPFGPDVPSQAADRALIEALSDVLNQADQLSMDLPGARADEHQITPRMLELRNAPLSQRKAAYRRHRVRDQRKWYATKATVNRGRENWFFIVVALAQLLAVGMGLTTMVWTEISLGWPGVFSALAAASLAWMQVKRHQELAQSYGVAAHELAMITEDLRHIDDDESFAEFVGSAEAAISREHTLWVARRDPLLGRHVRP